jgi:sulfite reductase (NADPH) hemoprotein beta-component
MGVTHGNKKTYPRLADVIGFCTVEEGPIVAEKVMLVQRDHGNRVEWVHSRCLFSVLTLCDHLLIAERTHV